jgi:PST family polysaccharide transporter
MAERPEAPRFASSIRWQTANVAMQVVLQLVFVTVLARLITPADFGVMAIALVVVGFLEIFAQVGIGPSLIQREDIGPAHTRTAFWVSLGLGTVFYLGLYAIAPWVGDFYGDARLGQILRLIAWSFILSGASVVPKSLLLREMAFQRLFVAAAVGMGLGTLGVGLGLAAAGWGVYAYVGALLAQNALLGIMYWWLRPVRCWGPLDFPAFRAMLGYGTRSTLYNVVNYLGSKVDTVVVGRSGWAQTGYYDRAVYLLNLPVTVLGKLSDTVLFSGLAQLQTQREVLRRTVLRAHGLLSLVVIPATVGLVCYAREATLLFLGPQYEPAVALARILFAGLAFRSLVKLGDAVVRATDHLMAAVWVKLGYLVLVAAGAAGAMAVGAGTAGVAWVVMGLSGLQFLAMAGITGRLLGIPAGAWVQESGAGLALGLAVAAGWAVVTPLLPDAPTAAGLWLRPTAGLLVAAAPIALAWKLRPDWRPWNRLH